MSWIRMTVKTIHLLVLLLICGMGFYSLSVRSQKSPPTPDRQLEGNSGALTIVHSSEQEQDDGVVIVNSDGEIQIENSEPFIPTDDWQLVKPGQAIPAGLHVRLNMQTGEKEAKLLQEEDGSTPQVHDTEGATQNVGDKLSLDELKKAVKSMKTEEFKSVDMETLKKEKNLRSYEELKEVMKSMNTDIKTDAEVISELVKQFQSVSPTQQDVSPLLEQLEYYLHQIDNAVLFCDLGAMPTLLRCLNSSMENVRSEAVLTLGAALQSNPKVQITAIENGAMHEVLRLVAQDVSPVVRKRAMYALSAMVRQFPFAQKRFLELGGLSVLGKLFDNKSSESLQVRAVTLLSDLVKEKSLNTEHTNLEDSTQKERLMQYKDVSLTEAMVETGWCGHIPGLLHVTEHDSREKVLRAMDAVLPACRQSFHSAVPLLRRLHHEYTHLLLHDPEEDEGDDGFFQGLVSTAEGLLAELAAKEEL